MIQLRPSAAHIWTNCAAQPALAATVPDEEPSDPAREGTCAAWVAEMVINGQATNAVDMVGQAHENGWVVDYTMARHVMSYVAKIREHNVYVEAERKVRLNDMIAGTTDAFAAIGLDTLFVDDLKYGYGIVEPWENPQVIIYAGGLIRELGIAPKRIVLGIYQPRAVHPNGPYRTWSLSLEELNERLDVIIRAANKTQDGHAVATAGEHCKYCRAAAICTAVARNLYRAHDWMHRSQSRHMTPSEIATELDFLETIEAMLKGRKEAVMTEAMARMARGENVVGWHRESGYGHRRWKFGRSTIEALTGVDPIDETKLISPAEMERRNVHPSVIAGLSETPRTKPTLKRIPKGHIGRLFGDTK